MKIGCECVPEQLELECSPRIPGLPQQIDGFAINPDYAVLRTGALEDATDNAAKAHRVRHRVDEDAVDQFARIEQEKGSRRVERVDRISPGSQALFEGRTVFFR